MFKLQFDKSCDLNFCDTLCDTCLTLKLLHQHLSLCINVASTPVPDLGQLVSATITERFSWPMSVMELITASTIISKRFRYLAPVRGSSLKSEGDSSNRANPIGIEKLDLYQE